MRKKLTFAAMAIAIMCGDSFAGIVVTQSNSAPTYGSTLNFDEVGGPTPADTIVGNEWQSSHDITSLTGGSGQAIADTTTIPWLPSGNAFYGPFGVFMTFDQPLTEMSFQGWDNGGPPGGFSGGAAVILGLNGVQLNGGNPYWFGTPSWGGFGGGDWFDITTTAGDTFNEVVFLGFAFGFPETAVDNLSWNAVPEPSSVLLVTGVVGMLLTRRRR